MREIEGQLVAEHLSPQEAAAEMLAGGGWGMPSIPRVPNIADLVRAHPYWSLVAALAAGMMASSMMSGADDVGLRFGRLNPFRRRARGAAPPAPPPIDPETKAAAEAAAPADDGGGGDDTSGAMHWPNTDGMHYMNGGFSPARMMRRPPHFRGRVRCLPRHFRRLSPRARVAVLGCLARMPPEANAALFGVLDDDLLAPAAATAINNNPAGPALLKALSDWHRFEHAKTHGAVSVMGWAMPWSRSTRLLASNLPYGSQAIKAHDVAKKAMKSGDLKPSVFRRALNLVHRGKKGDPAALARIAAVKKAAGRGNKNAEKALDTVKLAHATTRGPRYSGGTPIAFLRNSYRAGLSTMRT